MAIRVVAWAIILFLLFSAIGLAFKVAWGALSLIVVAAVIWWIYRQGWLGIGGKKG
jgi:hypothetical protein